MRDSRKESFLRVIGNAPLWLLTTFAVMLGNILYLLPNREKQNARVNIDICFPEYSDAQKRKLLKQTLIANLLTLLEMPAIWTGDKEKWKRRIDAEAVLSELKAIKAEGNGLIMAAPHLGNWEVMGHQLSVLGEITALYRPPRQKWIESIMTEGREQNGAVLVPTTRKGVVSLFRTLGEGGNVFILPDQQPKKNESGSVFAPFFQRKALTMTLISRLAEKTGAPVYFLFAARVNGKYRYRFYGHRASGSIASADPVVAATTLNQGVEKCIELFPEQYQWTYRRFEATDDGSVSPYKKSVT